MWLADPAINVRTRISRAIAVWRDTANQERSVLSPELVQQLDSLTKPLTAWASRCDPPLPRQRLPNRTDLFRLLYGAEGVDDYKKLSNLAHGSLLTVLLRRSDIANRSPEFYVESWQRVLVATRNGINAATWVHDLRGSDSDQLREAYALHGQLSGQLDAWVAEHSGS